MHEAVPDRVPLAPHPEVPPSVSTARRLGVRLLAAVLLAGTASAQADARPGGTRSAPCDYAVVVSQATAKAWAGAVKALADEHGARVISYEGDVSGARGELASLHPRHTCFVATPEEAGREFVVAVHRLVRALDPDPYDDCLYGILTGWDEEDLLRMIARKEPLSVRRGAAGTAIPLDLFREGRFWSESEAGASWTKLPGQEAKKGQGPADSTKAIVDELNGSCDYFRTSGHATFRDWQIGYSYRNGQLRCQHGRLFGIDLDGRRHLVDARGPRVYSAAGNCLMGRIVDRESMAIAWIHSGGVHQMTGYTVSTWYGYAGWGVDEYFWLGIHDFAESYFFAQQALLWRLQSRYPEALRKRIDDFEIERDGGLLSKLAKDLDVADRDELGLLWDRDTVAFYGDPAFSARLDRQAPAPWSQALTQRGNEYRFEVVSRGDGEWIRPPAAFLPRRIREAELLDGDAVVTDDFVLLPLSGKRMAGERHAVRFRAEPR